MLGADHAACIRLGWKCNAIAVVSRRGAGQAEALMKVGSVHYRTIWVEADGWSIGIIDQTKLPYEFCTVVLRRVDDAARAIRDMLVRGAPLIGATGAYGMCLAARGDASDTGLDQAYRLLAAARPTAINLRWALDMMRAALRNQPPSERVALAYRCAAAICEQDIAINLAIGSHGLKLIERAAAEKSSGDRVNVLTHCNAGWLATVDWGTATAPIYRAHDSGIPVHVWVDETRPRNQGASLTAWELKNHGVAHTVIADNLGGHLMQHGMVDLCIVGTDRTTATGDVANKVGTYLKALAARDNSIPFYIALPSPSIDWTITDGISEIPIEERDGTELSHVTGRTAEGGVATVRVVPEGSPVANYAFDVTPARLISGLITERGVATASRQGLAALFPEKVLSASSSAVALETP
jgi:methylthioribose-1-phosphate isomerase